MVLSLPTPLASRVAPVAATAFTDVPATNVPATDVTATGRPLDPQELSSG